MHAVDYAHRQLLMRHYYLFYFCILLSLSCAQAMATAATHTQSDAKLATWMDAALAGKSLPVSGESDVLQSGEVQVEQERIWAAYVDAAKRAGWDRRLLPVPQTIEQSKRDGRDPRAATRSLKSGDKGMPYLFMAKGEKPAAGWPLFISLHGGGKFHGEAVIKAHDWVVNTREWQAQMGRVESDYKPAGLYFIPRMADDRMGRWWHKHNIDIFTRMIRYAVLFNEVDANRIYIMGISQGGYGSGHLAPFMADLFAGAGPMAGGMMTVTENLRNLPYRTDIGEHDTAYARITLAKELHATIDAHKALDPEGYENLLAIQEGRGHSIDYSGSPSWLAKHTRNPYLERIVWRCHDKDGIYRSSFYWLSLTKAPETGEFSIVATLDKSNNRITILAEEVLPAAEEGGDAIRKPLTASQITVHLNDVLLDLDQEVVVLLNGNEAFKGIVPRSRARIMNNLVTRGDLNYAFPAEITVGSAE